MIDSKYPYHKNTNDPDNTQDPKKLKMLQSWNLNFQKKPNYPQKIKTQETLDQKSQ